MFRGTPTRVAAGTPADISCRHFLGVVLIPDGSNAADVTVDRGTSVDATKRVGGARCPATESKQNMPAFPVVSDPEGSIHVVVTGTNAEAVVYHST